LSAYIAQQNEPLVASEVLFGLRLSAAVSASIAFFAAGTAAVGKDCTSSIDQSALAALQQIQTTCTTRPAALIILIALVTASAMMLAFHSAIRRVINRPPEHKRLKLLQQRYWGDGLAE
jgi:uncharacterized BrkB/YihY/UPF0761 family membrane protein